MNLGRRERVRAATIMEITETARRLLVKDGPDAVSLRAIAREMGMTAPALYRYFPSHGDLLRHVVGALFNDLTDGLVDALAEVPDHNMYAKFDAACRAFRGWAHAHAKEYALLFATPVPGVGQAEQVDFAAECGRRFGMTFLNLFRDLWEKHPFPVPADDQIPAEVRDQLADYRERIQADLPLGCLLVFLQCWVRLHGAVSLEVFGHLDFALTDIEPFFELGVVEIAARLGLCPDPFADPPDG
ncbi:TetR/AcrR family transcriptional regulator [Actinocorallia sp. API 0066]|uniref:TetR/AcrR family transcriptional regulator n=1 Tax=Actinocorallia sp. API 0066 TaxID=2896846 RepID=UPI001E55789E|nr:TetR/AcrR family transcriptional regulator [Actinocorallia sp. API 0066]MCD0448073.1 TetR/AcrR family transcriptional regulator [Actinocorallia sp. API 0066]